MDLDIKIERLMSEYRRCAAEIPVAKARMKKLEEMKKTRLALEMVQAGKEGHKTAAAQEREAYASDGYMVYLDDLERATIAYESLRVRMEGVSLEAELLRTREASRRSEQRGYGMS